MWKTVVFLFLIGWISQGVLSYFQIKNYRQRIKQLKRKGYIGIGNIRKKLGRGMILLLVSNADGIIIDAEEMKGISVFARFRKNEKFVGYSLADLENLTIDNKTLKKAVDKAVEQIKEMMEKR